MYWSPQNKEEEKRKKIFQQWQTSSKILWKDINLQFQESQQVPNWINIKNIIAKHIKFKQLKLQNDKKILKIISQKDILPTDKNNKNDHFSS